MSGSSARLSVSGATPSPEGEQVSGHAATSGEVSSGTLANSQRRNSHLRAATPTTESRALEPLSIVRATGKIAVDTSLLADNESHALRKRLLEVRRSLALAANIAVRVHWRVDARIVQRYLVHEQRAPKAKEWQATEQELRDAIDEVAPLVTPAVAQVLTDKCLRKGQLDLFSLVRQIAPDVSSGIASALNRKVMQRWRTDRFKVLVQHEKAPPHYRGTLPIPIRASDMRFVRDGRRFLMTFNLSPGRHKGGEFTLPIEPRDGYQRQLLGDLADGVVKIGEAALTQDRLRKRKWFVRLAYTKQVPKTVETKRAAINRGITCFLAAVTDTGEQLLYDGDDIVAHLRGTQARRRQFQYQVKASGRVGHGRTRTLKPIDHLAGASDRWRDTRCKTIAARFAKWCDDRGVGVVLLEDFTGIRDGLPEKLQGGEYAWQEIQTWPYYRLQQDIQSALESYGIAFEQRDPAYISQTCPKCGHVTEDNIQLRRRKLVCVECKHTVHLDVAACENQLQGVTAPKSSPRKKKPVGKRPKKK